MNEPYLAPPDPRYATAREVSDVRERVTRLEASLLNLPTDVHSMAAQIARMQATLAEINSRISDMTRARDAAEARQDSPVNNLTLAIHRLVEDAERKRMADEEQRKPQPEVTEFAWKAASWFAIIAILALGGKELLGAMP